MAISIKIIPNASKNEYVGVLGESLKIKICTPPIEGKANGELIKFLSKKTGLSKAQIKIISGEKSHNKLIQVGSLTKEDLQKLLS